MTTNQNLALQPIVYDINKLVIIELKTIQDELLEILTDNIEETNIDLFKKELKKAVKLRTSTERQRKELKAGSLAYGRLVDSLAEEAQKPVAEIENTYNEIIKKYDEYFTNLAKLAAEKEELRIKTIRAKIDNYKILTGIAPNYSSEELRSHLEVLQKYLVDDFDFQEFSEEMEAVFKKSEDILKTTLENRLKYEADQAEFKKQKEIQDAAQAKFDAEKAEFAEKQRKLQEEANAKLKAANDAIEERARVQNEKFEAERKTIQDLKDKAESEERARIQKIEDEKRAKQIEEDDKKRVELQRIQDEENAKQQEELRQQHLKIQEGEKARKIAQEKEDRVKVFAVEMFALLKEIINSNMAMREEDEGEISEILNKTRNLIKLIKGE